MTETAATSSGTGGAQSERTRSEGAAASEPEAQGPGVAAEDHQEVAPGGATDADVGPGTDDAAGPPAGAEPEWEVRDTPGADLGSGSDFGGSGSDFGPGADSGSDAEPESVAVGRASVRSEPAPDGFPAGDVVPPLVPAAARVAPAVPDQAASAELFTPASERAHGQHRDFGDGGEHPTFTRMPGISPPQRVEDLPKADGHAEAYRLPTAVGYPPAPATMGLTSSGFLGSPIAVSAPPAPTYTGTATAPPSTRVTGPAGATGVTVRPIGTGKAVGAARVGDAVRTPRVSPPVARGPRRARLSVKRVDPWSVMKFSFAVSLVLFIVVIVAAAVLYLALDAMGVFSSINNTLADLIQSGGGGGDVGSIQITARGVIGMSALVGAVNVVLFTALATLGAFIYNVCADLVGGIEVTLAERD